MNSYNLPNILTLVLFNIAFLLNSSCLSPTPSAKESMPPLLLPTGEEIIIQLAVTQADQVKGLSGKQSQEFLTNEGMFFYYSESEERRFWMPDTYFDLDIFFLDEKLNVLYVERGVKAHPGNETPPNIATTKSIYCRHVLELRANSPLAAKIKIGTKLSWKWPIPYLKTLPDTRLQQ